MNTNSEWVKGVFFILALCCNVHSFAQRNSSDTVHFGNNVFKIVQNGGPDDTVFSVSPIDGMKKYTVIKGGEYMPVEMNGNKVYSLDEVNEQPQYLHKDFSFENYLLDSITRQMPIWPKMPDVVRMQLNYIVIDEHGSIVFYDDVDAKAMMIKDGRLRVIGFGGAIPGLMKNAPITKPAMLNGKAVPVRIFLNMANYKITVENGRGVYRKDNMKNDFTNISLH